MPSSEKKVSFGHLTHDVMKIVDESAKVKEKDVFDKKPVAKSKTNKRPERAKPAKKKKGKM